MGAIELTDIKENVRKLLFESGFTNYKISKETGIAQTTLGRFTRKESELGNMSLDNAIKLNDYYKNLGGIKMKKQNFKNLGTWWNSDDIQMVEIEGAAYALYGWNGEQYLDSWKCEGIDRMDASEERYIITPIQTEVNEDEFEIIGYQVQ